VSAIFSLRRAIGLCQYRFIWLFAIAAVCLAAEEKPSPTEPKVTAYAPDPNLLWNRLHAALAVRLTSWRGNEDIILEGDAPVQQALELDPLVWHQSRFLLRGSAHQAALDVLDEFLRTHGERQAPTPLARALLQRDLWALFDWLADPTWLQHRDNPGQKKDPTRLARQALATRLVQAIQRLALPADQLRSLPDNYQAAIAAATFAADFQPDQPSQAFLPRNLWRPGSPWVMLGDKQDQVLAQVHVQFFGGRSNFLVFLRLPGGREATTKFIGDLSTWTRAGRQGSPPQFPVETQVALVRQLILPDDQGNLVPTLLTESIQIRVFRRVDANINVQPEPAPENRFEIKLNRKELLAGKAGGLYAVKSDTRERDVVLFYGYNKGELTSPILESCRQCHQGPGIHAVNSFTRFVNFKSAHPELMETSAKDEAARVVEWTRKQPSWTLLNWLAEWPSR
jgi:hypothetical protein